MLEDSDVIFVDFDVLFENKAIGSTLDGDQYDDSLLQLLEDNQPNPPNADGSAPPAKKKRGPQPKAMTREHFYKIRPKVPKISKSDPRRNYATLFAAAYNSCDFEKIWEFIADYATKDIRFIQKWVGDEEYFNFPSYFEVRGSEAAVEYWFSRCVIVPDLVLELKETKLYVRSDGVSTVLSSCVFGCTRMYDGIISESLICRPPETTVIASAAAENAVLIPRSGEEDNNSLGHVDSNVSTGAATHSNSIGVDDAAAGGEMSVEMAEIINGRVMGKLELILLHSRPPPVKFSSRLSRLQQRQQQTAASNSAAISVPSLPLASNFKPESGSKRKLASNEGIDGNNNANSGNCSSSSEGAENDLSDSFTGNSGPLLNIPSASQFSKPSSNGGGAQGKKEKKLFPRDQAITVLGTVALHLNKEHKIRQIELTFALKQ